MGEVYRAKDTRLDRTVAIKVLPAHVSQDPERKARFEREAKTVASLNHPHICVLHDVGHPDGVDFLVMEYLQGETLADRVAKGALPIEQVLRYGTEIADALTGSRPFSICTVTGSGGTTRAARRRSDSFGPEAMLSPPSRMRAPRN